MAKGIRGLHFGGRAGLARKNLASLAPDFLPGADARDARTGLEGLDIQNVKLSKGNKRPAELQGEKERVGGGSGSTTNSTSPRPSKLAALSAARSSGVKPSTSNATSSVHATTDASGGDGKPLSKLQQRMQANLLARQQKKQTSLSKEDVALQSQKHEEEEQSKALLLPTGEPIASLFPTTGSSADEDIRHKNGNHSSFGWVLRSNGNDDLAVPGGSPFLAPSHLEAFSKPSPDDIVSKAREGTNLAKT